MEISATLWALQLGYDFTLFYATEQISVCFIVCANNNNNNTILINVFLSADSATVYISSECVKRLGNLHVCCLFSRYNLCIWTDRYRKDVYYGRSPNSAGTARHHSQFLCSCIWRNCKVGR